MSQFVVVDEPSVTRTDDQTVVSATVTVPDGASCEVCYVLPPVAVHRQQVIDAMFVVGRLVAMKGGWRLVLPGAVSGRLLDRAEILQDIFLEWFGARAKPMPLDFEAAEPLDLPAGRGTLSTFSGGVDSYYTALESLQSLSGLLFVHGLDIGLHHTDFRAQVRDELVVAASDLGLPLLEVETNVRDLTNPYANWGQKAHGAILSSVAILLAERVDTFLVPGTLTRGAMNGQGWGSHVVIDRLNSTDYLSVVHHGADTCRPEKVARVALHEGARRHLRVCYSSRSEYNCGRCSKCRRTQIDLALAGVTDYDHLFAEALPLQEALARLQIGGAVQRKFTEETMARARVLGRRDVVVPLKRAIRRYDSQQVKKSAIVLRGVLRKDPEFRAAFIPKQRKRPRLPAGRPLPPTPPPTLRAVIAHRVPESVVRRFREVRASSWTARRSGRARPSGWAALPRRRRGLGQIS